jgi:transcriptional regulator with XRE-family HTH domain
MERSKTRTKAPDARDVDVGRRIRAQRLVCRMSQTELANNLGVTFQQVQKYEKGVNRVGAGRLARIAEVLGVPVAFFFSGDLNPPVSSDSANTGLSFLETAGAVRLVRAYSTIEDPQIRRALVDLSEEIAGARGREPGRHAGVSSEARRRARKDGRRARLS